jgi:uncharacterized protein
MAEPSVRKPALVLTKEGGSAPLLRARRCTCGHVSFPPQSFGCERCGREGGELSDVELATRGVLTAVVQVYVHSKIPVPYAIGRVQLDEGPAIDAPLDGREPLAIGTRVVGALTPTDDASSGAEFRFAREGSVQ